MAAVPKKGNMQSAALQGAAQAFAAKTNHPTPATSTNNRNGAQTAASLAEDNSRQKVLTHPESHGGGLQVRQIIHSIQHANGGKKSQTDARRSAMAPRTMTRSPSYVAARIASRSSSVGSAPPRDGSATPPDIRAPGMDDGFRRGSFEYVRQNRHQGPSERDDIRDAVHRLQKGQSQRKSPPYSALRTADTTGPFDSSCLDEQHLSEPISDAGDDSAHAYHRGRTPSSHAVVLPTGEDSIGPKPEVSSTGLSPILNKKHPNSETPDNKAVSELPAQFRSQRSRLKPEYVDQRSGMTETSLADAIVASSLASSRVPSPSKNVPVPSMSRKSSFSRSLFTHIRGSESNPSRYGSPQRGMRHTLRDHVMESSEDDHVTRKHKPFMKHPNKHHEGSRKRWKGMVAERERKRYEGVWAANKGILCVEPALSRPDVGQKPPASDLVLDLVVRDIWNRSRLPADTLGEVWDLVDRGGRGMLSRDEFVLGLWLIDQKLKGRKLPIRLSQTLWASVSHGPEYKEKYRLR